MKKGLAQVLFANIIFLLVGIVSNFLLPKYLSIESYSYIKTYALYISYAGFFHLGYNDGMYLKYGGKKNRKYIKKGFKYKFFELYFCTIDCINWFSNIWWNKKEFHNVCFCGWSICYKFHRIF